MAAHVHNPSRRALLGAAVALSFETPVRQAHRLLGMSDEGHGEWERLLTAYRAAEAAAGEVAGDAALEEDYGDRLGDLYEVLRRLLRLPAPGLGAFALKVVLAIDHELGTLAGGGPCLAAIRRDALRLAAEQNSNILFPPGPAIPK